MKNYWRFQVINPNINQPLSEPKFIGQPIAIILARCRQRALEIAASANVEMQFKAEIGKNGVFVSLDDAIEGKSFHGEMKLEAECGEDWDLIESDKNLIKIEAEVRTNPQFHAYAEPIAAICDYDNGRYKIKINSQVFRAWCSVRQSNGYNSRLGLFE